MLKCQCANEIKGNDYLNNEKNLNTILMKIKCIIDIQLRN